MSAKPTTTSWLLTIAVYALLGPLIGVIGFLLMHDEAYGRMNTWGPIARLLTAVAGFFVGLIPAIFTGMVMGALRWVKLWIRIIVAPAMGAAATYLTGLAALQLGPQDAGVFTLIRCGAFAALMCALAVGAVEGWRTARAAGA